MNPSNFLGLMKEKEERDEFAYKSDDDEEEEEEKEEVGEENETIEGKIFYSLEVTSTYTCIHVCI